MGRGEERGSGVERREPTATQQGRVAEGANGTQPAGGGRETRGREKSERAEEEAWEKEEKREEKTSNGEELIMVSETRVKGIVWWKTNQGGSCRERERRKGA